MARTRGKGLERLSQMMEKLAPFRELAVVHSTAPDDAQWLRERLSHLSSGPVYLSRVGPALGVHAGPGTVAVFARRGERE